MTQDHLEHRPLPSAQTASIQAAPIPTPSVPESTALSYRPPVAGALCVIFAVAAFYRTTLLLAPLALVAGIIALCRRQYAWAAIGIIAAAVALLTDIVFWSLLGAAWMVRWLGWV